MLFDRGEWARTRVKVCGVTTPEAARVVVACGADALGIMFYRASPRWVSFETAARIVAELPPLVVAVGVFVDPAAEFVGEAIDRTGIGALQFHGSEAPDFCTRFGLPSIKAFRLRDRASLVPLASYSASAWLLDSFVPGQPGGSGRSFNWDLAVEPAASGHAVLLAGGLDPDNVGDAIERVRPYAVDVSSGVESAPGQKDPARVRRFVESVRAADRRRQKGP